MANESTKLEDRLLELGKGLASPPSSADELYSLLHLIDGLLSIVEQSPSESMLDALQPLMKALAVKEFLRHSNMDVKVAVASCISEITRITAPEAPYDDDIMKEIFQMIVEAFEGLDDTTSRSFQKRVSILETVAKVRSCVVMLDLECDALILRMFHHFLKTIRTDHSANVFTSMKTIMTLVIDESEDISSELLSALLDTLKKDNKDVRPIAERLAEKVMHACASKLKPYMVELIQSGGASLSDYNEVVASICQESSGAFDHVETHVSREALEDDSKLSERTVSDELPQVSAKLEQEVGCPEKVGTAAETSPVAATSNGDVQMGNGDTMEQPSSPKRKSKRSRRNGQFKNIASDGTDIGNVESTAVKPDGTTHLKKAKGRKTNSSAQLTDNIDRMDSDKDAPVVTSRRKRPCKEGEAASAQEGKTVSAQDGETAVSLEHDKKNELQHLPGSDGPTSDPLPSPISSPPNSSRAKRGRPPGQKGAAKRGDVDASADTPAPASVQNDPAENSQAHDEMMPSKGDDSKEPEDAGDVEAPTGLTSDSEVKPRNTGKQGRFKRKAVEREYSGTKQSSNTKQQKEEESHGKDGGGEPSLKETASLPGFALKALSVGETRLDDSVKTKSRRKRALETKKISETPDHKKQLDEHLVGSRIKVWWPDDKMFYEGIVDSYDPLTRKHKIVYTDGDVEVLMLKKEQWESAESDPENDGRKRKAEGSASQMGHNKKAKGSSTAVSKQAKFQAQSESGTEIGSRDVPRPRGRPRSGTSDIGKLSYENSPGTSKKSKGIISSDKEKTPRSSGKKQKDGPDNEPEDGNPRTSSKREESGDKSKKLASKPGSAAKGDTSKNSRKLKDEPSKSSRKARNETSKASTKLKDDGGKSGDDTTPKTASRDEPDEAGKKKTPRTKPKTNSTPKAGGDSKANGVSSKGKTKVGESESIARVSDGEVTTGSRKQKRRGRK